MASPAALAAFFSESDTHIEVIEQSLIRLEKEKDNKEVINELFRAVHSMKGNAGLVGMTEVHQLSTQMETALDEARSGRGALGQDVKDKLFEDFDRIKALVEKARGVAPEQKAGQPASAADDPADAPHEGDEGHKEGAKAQKHAEPGGKQSFLTFTIGKEEYGFPITSVREIILRRQITRVPNTKPFVRGIMNLRGMVIPVVDTRRKLGFAAGEDKAENIIIVENEGMVTGVLVDTVKDIASFEPDKMVSAEKALGAMKSEFVGAIGKAEKHSIMLLDIAKFCDPKERYY